VSWKPKPRKKRGMFQAKNRKVKVSKLLSHAIQQIEYKRLETKNQVVNFAATALTGAAYNSLAAGLGNIAQGVTEATRVGESITPIGIRFSYTVVNTLTGGSLYARLIVMCSKNLDNAATSTTVNEIFQDYDRDGLTFTAASATPNKIITLPLFNQTLTPVYSRVIKLNANASDYRNTGIISGYIPLKGTVKFEGTTGGFGVQNHIWMIGIVAWAPNTTLALSTFTVEGTSAFMFKDG